eukprot:TRINITY_DN1538_c0_g2_i1.p1 TRINITY_DN1538_c0_g2~~TRINITY_DN1538_c0_g2_i1.p1  ORF type:complete len:277 (+),score=76.58 TRINITY_DN1538_c0_g2_i1:54-884(+)
MTGSDTPTVFYFGYGSNMLKANLVGVKGVEPVRMIPGVLRGYELDFSFTQCGMGTGNITANEDEEVHGALIEVTRDGWEKLQRFESGYKEVKKMVTPYKERIPVEASVFIVTQEDAPGRYDKDGQPSANYLKILIKGAEELGIDQAYVKQLKNVEPVNQRTQPTPDEIEKINSKTFTIDEVKALEGAPHTIIRGIVLSCPGLPVVSIDSTSSLANRWVHATPENTASPDQYPPELVEYLQVALYDELITRYRVKILGKLATGHDGSLGYDDYPEHF